MTTLDLAERLLRLEDFQRVILRQVQGAEMAKRLAVRFTDPDKDQESIRRAAYLDGGLDMLNYLLGFDQQILEEAEAAKQELLNQQQAQSNGEPPFSTTF